MLSVAAMAVRNVLVQLLLDGAPTTTVIKTSITRLTIDAGTVLFSQDTGKPVTIRKAPARAGSDG
jgi:hypothetical protein